MKEYQHGDNSAVPLGHVALARKSDGTLSALTVDSSGNLAASITGAGSGGTSAVDKAAFSVGSSAGTPLMGVVTPSDTVPSGDMAVAALDVNRNLKVNVVAGGSGGGAVTVADGSDVALGALADAGVISDASGSLSAKLRGLIVLLLRFFALATPIRIDPVGSTAQPVSGTVTTSPPAHASTNVDQIGGSTMALGQQLAAASVPVVLTSAQQTALTPPAAITGFALETGGNLAAIKADVDKIPSQGQALAAASTPVVLPAAQISTLTPPTTVTVQQSTAASLKVDLSGTGANTAKLLVTPDSVALPANQSININQIGAVSAALTHNNAAPAANNIGVLPAIANASPPTFTEGDQVLESVDLRGRVRTKEIGSGFTSGQVSIDTTSGGKLIIAANATRMRLLLQMTGATQDVYVGPSGVTTSTGALFAAIKGNQFLLRTSAAVYGTVASGTQTISYLEETS